MERRNKDGARVMGVNLEGKMAYAWLQLQAGATIQRSRYKEAVTWSETNPDLPAQKKMFRTPDVYGYFTSTFTPVKRLAISFTGTYTGTMLVQHLAGYIPEDREEKTPDFFDLNMKVAYDFPLYKSVTLQVNAGVQNILEAYQSDFDQGKDRDSKYIYGPGMPRSYFVGCKISYYTVKKEKSGKGLVSLPDFFISIICQNPVDEFVRCIYSYIFLMPGIDCSCFFSCCPIPSFLVGDRG